jgi:predicted CoA-binding protein
MSQKKLPSSTMSPSDVLRKYKTIAVVGASKNPEKEAHKVPLYMKEHGYRIIPVNPTTDSVLGEKSFPSLSEIPPENAKQVEIVDVFRKSEELPEVARQAVEMTKRSGKPTVFWAQLGLENDEAKQILSDNGLQYVMNACVRMVHQNQLRKTTSQ